MSNAVVQTIKINNSIYDDIYKTRVVLFHNNINAKTFKKHVYNFMKILKKREVDIKLLLDKVITNHKCVCYEGSTEECETVLDSLLELKFEAILV